MRRSRWIVRTRQIGLFLLLYAGLLVISFLGGRWSTQLTSPPSSHINLRRLITPVRKVVPAAQQALAAKLSQEHFSGSAVVVRRGHVIAQYVAGMADATSKAPNTINTMYEIDSMQKSLTAGLVMQLIHQHKLNLTTPIGKFYNRFADLPKITIKKLLQMSSGLRTKGVITPRYTTDHALIAENEAKVIYEPARFGHYQYTPVNYLLLAGICEKVTGKSYEELFHRLYVKRLGLTHTAMAYNLNRSLPSVAIGYNDYAHLKALGSTADQAHAELGTGQVYMSVGDLFKAESALVSGKLIGNVHGALYQGSNYNGGFYIRSLEQHTNGTGYGFCGTIHLTPDGESGVALISNVQAANRGKINEAASQLMRMFYPSKSATEPNVHL